MRQTEHYPPLDWPLIVAAKRFVSRTRTGPHSHDRGQLMFPSEGFVVANTAAGTWFVPHGHALWIPPNLDHDISMHSDVVMHATYLRSAEAGLLPRHVGVMKVGHLLAAAIEELDSETRIGRWTDRTAHLTWLVLDEIGRAPATTFVLPLPEDARLLRLAHALIAEPGSDRTIDQWCDVAGLSRRTMTRHFRSETGLSFGGWRRRLRLIVAITRIAEGEPTARVAASLGYGNVAAFRAMARRCLGADLLAPKSRTRADALCATRHA